MLLVSATSGVAKAEYVACPASSNGRPLSFITVFDGSPSDKASLVPDSTRRITGGEISTWQVDDIYKAGRIIYISCEYGNHKAIILKVKRSRVCQYTERAWRKSLFCE